MYRIGGFWRLSSFLQLQRRQLLDSNRMHTAVACQMSVQRENKKTGQCLRRGAFLILVQLMFFKFCAFCRTGHKQIEFKGKLPSLCALASNFSLFLKSPKLTLPENCNQNSKSLRSQKSLPNIWRGFTTLQAGARFES